MSSVPRRHHPRLTVVVVGVIAVVGVVALVIALGVAGHTQPKRPARTQGAPQPSFPYSKCPRTPPQATQHPGICERVTDGPLAFVVAGAQGGFRMLGDRANNEHVLPPNQYIAVYIAVTNSGAEPVGLADIRGHDSAGQTQELRYIKFITFDGPGTNSIPPGETTHMAAIFAEPDTAHMTWIELHGLDSSHGVRVSL